MHPERARGTVAAVVLAAGTSSRMGRNKLLLPVGSQSVVRRAVGTALAAGLAPVLVVVGHEHARLQRELQGLDCTAVLNPAYAEGLHTSLRTGIAAVPAGAQGAVVLLADMPRVSAEMLRILVQSYHAGAAPLVVSSYDGVDAPPMLYDRSLFLELLAVDGGGGGKLVVKRHRSEAAAVLWPASALADLDVPADVDAFLSESEGP